jgi:hypothetical protein
MVELACFIALTMGQQSWIRLLNIDHYQVMAETTASLVGGFEGEAAVGESAMRAPEPRVS